MMYREELELIRNGVQSVRDGQEAWYQIFTESPYELILRLVEELMPIEPEQRNITVNGKLLIVTLDTLTYEGIVSFAFEGMGLVRGYPTVVYTRGHSESPSGTLVYGQSVKIKNGMNFDVAFTGNA
jgi:hypothetical protein